jgi:DNA-binding winged helix-turn-helix (wHTH) protein
MSEPVRLRFGSYVIDSEARTLNENGTPIALQPKPFLLLEALVRRHGQVVSREELAKVLWPDTFVQIDQGLNAAVKKVRSVLHDDAKSPRFIETLGSRGYRFICPVEVIESFERPVRENEADNSHPLTPSSLHEQVVRARYQLSQHTRSSISRSITLFNEALKEDPKHAPAYAGLANAYAMLGDMNLMQPHAAYEAARTNARRALELDADMLDAMVPMGWTTLLLNRDWKAAHGWMERALEINPRHSLAFTMMGRMEMMRGRRAEALALARHARFLSPLSVVNNVTLAKFLYFSLDFEAAASQAMQTMEMNPGAKMMVLPVLCGSMLAMGRTKEAIALLSAHLENEEEMFPVVPTLAIVLAHDDRKQEAQAVIRKTERNLENRPTSSYLLSFAYGALGDHRQAENWMLRAIQERDHCSIYLAVDPHARDYTDLAGVRPWMDWLRHQAA